MPYRIRERNQRRLAGIGHQRPVGPARPDSESSFFQQMLLRNVSQLPAKVGEVTFRQAGTQGLPAKYRRKRPLIDSRWGTQSISSSGRHHLLYGLLNLTFPCLAGERSGTVCSSTKQRAGLRVAGHIRQRRYRRGCRETCFRDVLIEVFSALRTPIWLPADFAYRADQFRLRGDFPLMDAPADSPSEGQQRRQRSAAGYLPLHLHKRRLSAIQRGTERRRRLFRDRDVISSASSCL